MNIPSEVITHLVTLGFPEDELRSSEDVDHPLHLGLRVATPHRNATPTAFVLCFHPRRDHYPTSARRAIPRKRIDAVKPRWRQSVDAWFNDAVMTAARLRREREEQESREIAASRRVDQTLVDMLPANLKHTAPLLRKIAHLSLNHDGTLYDISPHMYQSISNRPDASVQEKLIAIAELADLLHRHGMKKF